LKEIEMRPKHIFMIIALATVVAAGPALAAPGDTLKSFAAPYMCPQGLAFDGTHLWNIDRKSDMIYRINIADGAVSDSIPAPAYIPRGLTWDGDRLWTVDAGEELIFAVNPKNNIVEVTLGCPVSSPYGLAWDGKYLWIADDSDDKIHQISPEDGTTIKSIPAPSSHPGALAFDGRYLWVSDRYKDMIYMITPEKGDVIVSFKAPGPHSCGLTYDGSHLWNVDYQTDRIYKLVIDDGTLFSRLEEKHQQIEFIHQVRNFGPGMLPTLDIYLAVPIGLDNQDLVGEVSFSPEPAGYLTDTWGQKVAHFQFNDVAATQFVDVSMQAEAKLYDTRYYIFPEKVGPLTDVPREIRDKYLKDDAKFSMSDPVIQKGVREAVGDETNPYWIGRNIYEYVMKNVEYELAGGWDIAPTVLGRGSGSCSEFTFVFIAMCRAAGLPARYVGSLAIRGDDASWDDVFHRWAEIYFPNYGWIPADPSRGDSKWPSERADSFGHVSNRLLITTAGGGGSEYLEWGYNNNERWTSTGRAKVVVENFAEWSPVTAVETVTGK
jgi:transglutaminase-like putative cysteine protease